MNSIARASFLVAVVGTLVATSGALAADPAAPFLKREAFDRDPQWEGWNNHVTPSTLPTVVQDFGFTPTHFAATAAGELGGLVTRASEPAFYAANIGHKTLDDWRSQIDALDAELLRLLNQRAAIACEIASIKVASSLPA